jgi:hypothetical protein
MKRIAVFGVLVLFATVRNISASNCKCLENDSDCHGDDIDEQIQNCTDGVNYQNYNEIFLRINLKPNTMVEINLSFNQTLVKNQDNSKTKIMLLQLYKDGELKMSHKLEFETFPLGFDTKAPNANVSKITLLSSDNGSGPVKGFASIPYEKEIRFKVTFITNDIVTHMSESLTGTAMSLAATDDSSSLLHLSEYQIKSITSIIYKKNYSGNLISKWFPFVTIGAVGGVIIVLVSVLVCLFIKKRKHNSEKKATPKAELSENLYYDGSSNIFNEGASVCGRATNTLGIVVVEEQGQKLSNLNKAQISQTHYDSSRISQHNLINSSTKRRYVS